MKLLSTVLLFVMLSGGCVALEPAKRWTNENIFYSSRSPDLTIVLPEGFYSRGVGDRNTYTTEQQSGYDISSTLNREAYSFVNVEMQSVVNIEIQNVGNELFFLVPDYSNIPYLIESERKMLKDKQFYTAIYLTTMIEEPVLVKQWTHLIGKQGKIDVIYLEPIDRSYLQKNMQLLTGEQLVKINEFKERASGVQILPYDLPSQVSNFSYNTPPSLSKPKGSTQVRIGSMNNLPLAVSWDGVAELVLGKLHIGDTSNKGRLSASIPTEKVECAGFWIYQGNNSGDWNLTCDNGKTANGTYSKTDKTHGHGEGTDNQDNRVKFTFGD